jgi:serine/threonine-protein kinase
MSKTQQAPRTHELAEQVLSGRYRLVRQLGEGAIGQVYEVIHLQLGRRFAAKVLREQFRSSPMALARFRREAKLGGLLRSEHTVEVVDFDETGGVPYFVMEYLEGETLHALIAREGVLPVRRAATLLVHACRGIRRAHALGILHRDLKPSNLFVVPTEDGEVCKVLDFGVAKASEDAPASATVPSTLSGAIIGTLNYMPPEQLRGQRDLDERVDVYALATIFYECLTGERAFDAPTPPHLMYQILEESPRSLTALRPELPHELVAVVERAMATERDDRTPSIEALERDLLPFAEGASSSLPESHVATQSDVEGTTPRKQRARSPSSRIRSKAGLLLSVGVFAGTLAGALGYRATAGARAAARERTSAPARIQTQAFPEKRSDARALPTHPAAMQSSALVVSADSTSSIATAKSVLSNGRPRANVPTRRTRPIDGASHGVALAAPEARSAARPVDDYDRENPYKKGKAKE